MAGSDHTPIADHKCALCTKLAGKFAQQVDLARTKHETRLQLEVERNHGTDHERLVW
jgi:hypothetical protein